MEPSKNTFNPINFIRFSSFACPISESWLLLKFPSPSYIYHLVLKYFKHRRGVFISPWGGKNLTSKGSLDPGETWNKRRFGYNPLSKFVFPPCLLPPPLTPPPDDPPTPLPDDLPPSPKEEQALRKWTKDFSGVTYPPFPPTHPPLFPPDLQWSPHLAGSGGGWGGEGVWGVCGGRWGKSAAVGASRQISVWTCVTTHPPYTHSLPLKSNDLSRHWADKHNKSGVRRRLMSKTPELYIQGSYGPWFKQNVINWNHIPQNKLNIWALNKLSLF